MRNLAQEIIDMIDEILNPVVKDEFVYPCNVCNMAESTHYKTSTMLAYCDTCWKGKRTV